LLGIHAQVFDCFWIAALLAGLVKLLAIFVILHKVSLVDETDPNHLFSARSLACSLTRWLMF